MKTLLAWIGAASLVLWTGAGLVAWKLTKDHVTLVLEEGGEPSRAVAEDPLGPLVQRLDELGLERRALAETLQQNLGVLDERAEARASELEAGLRAELASTRRELTAALDTLARRSESRFAALEAGSAQGSAAPSGAPVDGAGEAAAPIDLLELPPTSADAVAGADAGAGAPSQGIEASEAPREPASKPSFLAFRLPADDFRFDERRTWKLDPALSRVGFDGKSTLHDFSGTTSTLSGSMELDLSRPDAAPRGEVRVVARSLTTDSEGRDEEMWDDLDVEHHAEIRFRLERFEPTGVDPTAATVTGTARGQMRIRGVERPFAMPVRATVDASRRLRIEGEASLSLPDWDVPVPNKLGLISMEPDVVVWIALCARLEPREDA